MKIKLPLFILSFLSFGFLLSQQDFNKYRTLQSAGNIPFDFSALTYQKIEADQHTRSDLSSKQEKIFLRGIHYGIDDLLHSGLVVYGDEVSLYIQSVVDKLLSDQPELKSKLRFYTLKANETNAFSTDQGIVFVTTGLISQLTSEAQLAFVLAHEISHYTEKHVIETFQYKSNNRRNAIRDLSVYSKEKEFEADRLGLAIYHKVGYSKDELLPSFDVLMYSYLPFDEVEFPKSYFNSSLLFVPESLFPEKKYEIKAEENYDDTHSSHPNIKKRKEQIEAELDKYADWGNAKFYIGEQRFEYIRTICRFESVRTDVLDANYADAIYSIFLLEKEHPKSTFLKQLKAQAWLGLVQYKKNGNINETVNRNADLEGEIAAVHYFIKKLSRDGLMIVALRQIYELREELKEDRQLNAIYSSLINELVDSDQFKLENFSKKTFHQAADEFLEKKQMKNVHAEDSTVKKTASKYDKIKSKKNVDNPDNFDSTKFYLYGISDLLEDSVFIQKFKASKSIYEQKRKEKEAFDRLSYKEQRTLKRKEEDQILQIGINEMIIVEPMVFSYKQGEIDLITSEKLKHDFSQMIENVALETGVKVYEIDRDNLATKGTVVYNERSTLFAFMTQVSREDNFNIFPVDYSLLEELKKNYGTSKVMFTWVEHAYNPKISLMGVVLGVVVYPVLPIYIPLALLSGHNTNMNVIILDIEKGSIDVGTSYYMKDTPKRFHLGAHMYNIFQRLQMNKTIN